MGSDDQLAELLSHFPGVTVIGEEAADAADSAEAADSAVAAKAAELRALQLATARALVQQRAAFLADILSRLEVVKAEFGGHENTHSQLQVARANTAVAKAREELAKAELQALQVESF